MSLEKLDIQSTNEFCKHGDYSQGCSTCKQELLDAAEQRIENFYTDYGVEGKERVGVDKELKQLIAFFLAMGFETDQSCWGHPERRNVSSEKLEFGEMNYLPYIELTGYQPSDGVSPDGRAIGYTKDQVKAACAKMAEDQKVLSQILNEFYSKKNYEMPWIILNYPKGMPSATLDTQLRRDYNDDPENLDAEVIEEVQDQWQAFSKFVADYFLSNNFSVDAI